MTRIASAGELRCFAGDRLHNGEALVFLDQLLALSVLVCGRWQSACDIVLRRFAEFHRLEGALGRRALTERAKGILMERHRIDEREAFERLRSHSRRTGRKLIDVAEAVTTSHLLLVPQAAPGSNNSQPADPRVEDVPTVQPED